MLFSTANSFYAAHIHQITGDPLCTFYPLCTDSQRFQEILPKKWKSIIGTQALHIISIFIWGITPHKPDNLAPQIPSLTVFWSHSGWSPGWADSPWKATLFNEQRRAWVHRQQVECQINALQLGMDHFSCQLSAQIIIIKKGCLQKCSCYHGICLRCHQLLEGKKFSLAVVQTHQLSWHGGYPGEGRYVSDSMM